MERIANSGSAKLPVDTYTRQLYNGLPVAEVEKVIEDEKAPAPPFKQFANFF